MKERPILFQGAMVRALLDGSKTQTRRIMKPQPEPTLSNYYGKSGHWWPSNAAQSMVHIEEEMQKWTGMAGGCCPYGDHGDRLWARETWYCDDYRVQKGPYLEVDGARELTVYYADNPRPYEAEQPVWRPSIHMPRWASRILLEIVSVRVERLQDISATDCIAEGIRRVGPGWERWHPDPADTEHTGSTQDPRSSYCGLWESINGAGSWAANPWVWVVEFKRVLP